jgi:hypothetical protein
MNLYERFLGYGNRYFRFYTLHHISIGRECCDNRDQDMEDYQEKKKAAYDLVMDSASRMFEEVPFFTVASNCGALWTKKGNIRRLHKGSEHEWNGS